MQVFAPIETSQAGPDQVAGSPGLQWLQHLGVADSRSSLERGRFSMLPSATAWLSRKSRQLLGYLPSDQPASDHTVSTAPQEAAVGGGQAALGDSKAAVAGDGKALSNGGSASFDKQRLPELAGSVAPPARQDPLRDSKSQEVAGNRSTAVQGSPNFARASHRDRDGFLPQPVMIGPLSRARQQIPGWGTDCKVAAVQSLSPPGSQGLPPAIHRT